MDPLTGPGSLPPLLPFVIGVVLLYLSRKRRTPPY
jgi:hypothetical protein